MLFSCTSSTSLTSHSGNQRHNVSIQRSALLPINHSFPLTLHLSRSRYFLFLFVVCLFLLLDSMVMKPTETSVQVQFLTPVCSQQDIKPILSFFLFFFKSRDLCFSACSVSRLFLFAFFSANSPTANPPPCPLFLSLLNDFSFAISFRLWRYITIW